MEFLIIPDSYAWLVAGLAIFVLVVRAFKDRGKS